MSDTDNVIFFYSGTSYQFQQNPSIQLNFEHLKESDLMANKITKIYHEGYKPHISLSWTEPTFLRYADYDILRTVFNTHSIFSVNLSPISSPGASFTVNWMNDLSPSLVEGMTPFGFTLNVVLEGTSVLSEVPQIRWGDG